MLTSTQYRITGKERDAGGEDYFGARYYAFRQGRFLTPDWSATPQPVPYAQLGSPQTLNLYAYVQNNPITGTDPDGHFEANQFTIRSQTSGISMEFETSDVAEIWGPEELSVDVFTYLLDGQNVRLISHQTVPVAQQQMITSAAGVAFIKGWERWNGTYDKAIGKWLPKDDGFGNGTIGWGHNCGKCADFAGGITKAEGDALLTKDLGRFEGAVNGLGANLSQQQFDGLVAFAFNVRNFGGSTLFSNVASGNAVTELYRIRQCPQ